MQQEILARLPVSQGVLELIIVGVLLVVGLIFGRAFCGKFCLFGFLQDWLYKIPFPVKIRNFKGDKVLRVAKYLVLPLPLVLIGLGIDSNKIVPPSAMVGALILAVVGLVFIMINRAFCMYLCPIGAIHAIGNKTSIRKYKLDASKCNKCGVCTKSCKMDIVPYKAPNSLECIRCENCIRKCPGKAISIGKRF